MAGMDPWKRYRLLACIVVMLGIMAAAAYGMLRPRPPAPATATNRENGAHWEFRQMEWWRIRDPDPIYEIYLSTTEGLRSGSIFAPTIEDRPSGTEYGTIPRHLIKNHQRGLLGKP
jgi:hypothetical protein